MAIVPDRDRVAPLGEVLRDITRGGLAGLIAGILLGGIGGRLVMRLAAVLVPRAAGSVTESGNVIGAITPGGTAALIVFVGLFFGAVAGSLWVVVGPWLPDRPGARALIAVPIAIGLGTLGLVDGANRDFAILGRDPLVIASLVTLVGLFGPGLVLAERWLDRRLPHPAPGTSGVLVGYAVVAVLGTALTLLAVLPLFLGSDLALAGAALVVVGLATGVSWWRRVEGHPGSSARLVVTARVGLAAATAAGLVVATREVGRALGIA